ncbi:restriction endonuclease [Corallococcus caeni]
MPVPIHNAFYIKLGERGRWEADCISNARIRVDYPQQDVADINRRNWTRIKEQLDASETNQSVATSDLNRLQDLTASGPGDVWTAFHQGRLWWTRIRPGPFLQDEHSKYRRTEAWCDKAENNKLLVASSLPGKIASLQAFRGTICRVREKALLQRVLEGRPGELAVRIGQQRSGLEAAVLAGIRELHPKDFETLVDLVFRHAGWARTSILGQQVKSFDLELTEPLTGDRYVVQVKSAAGRPELDETLRQFPQQLYRRVFFVVHSPTPELAAATDLPAFVQVVDPAVLARMAVSAGLSSWIEEKVI